ncbi:MAG: NUDIX domain-containing protein, partial [Chloroflexia bacterium]|nr:NUDIX domain-containing protein [Chloroflexia bacterium]
MTIKRKAFAYITSGPTSGPTSGHRLLVFSHPLSPEAGIQVPAGTIDDGETPEEAVLREASQETGLPSLTVV